MAHKKAGGRYSNGRDSHSKRLGDGRSTAVKTSLRGNILIRQRGTVYRPASMSASVPIHTLFAKAHGIVEFRVKGAEQHTTSTSSRNSDHAGASARRAVLRRGTGLKTCPPFSSNGTFLMKFSTKQS